MRSVGSMYLLLAASLVFLIWLAVPITPLRDSLCYINGYGINLGMVIFCECRHFGLKITYVGPSPFLAKNEIYVNFNGENWEIWI